VAELSGGDEKIDLIFKIFIPSSYFQIHNHMNISRRNIIFIILGLVAIGLLAWWFWYRQQLIQVTVGPQDNNYNNSGTNTNTNTQPVDQTPTQVVGVVTNVNANLKNVATLFTERYGSYSTDANFENLKSVESLSTPELVSSLKKLIKDGEGKPVAGFYGVTTKVVTVDVLSQNSSTAEVEVATQRQESFSREGEVKITYQALKLSLDKQGNNWLVSSADWVKQ